VVGESGGVRGRSVGGGIRFVKIVNGKGRGNMERMEITILIIAIIQEYICWMTYKNWFDHEITYCKMKDSYSIIGMSILLPFVIWIPIIPIVVIWYTTGKKYLTARWMF
jgi:hypothetical protein